MWQKYFWIVPGIISIFSALAHAEITRLEQYANKNLVNHSFQMAPIWDKVQNGYGDLSGHRFFYVKSLDRIFFQEDTIEVFIEHIHFNDDCFSVKLHSNGFGNGSINFRLFNMKTRELQPDQLQQLIDAAIPEK